MNLRQILSLSVFASTLAATACGALLGIEDGILDTATVDGSLPDGDVSDGFVPSLETGDEPSIDTTPPCIPDVADSVDETLGVFVAGSGVGADTASCGDLTSPCASVQNGINRALAIAGKKTVYVASGDYVEAVHLAAGLTIDGGWEIFGGKWLRNCTATPNAAVRLLAPSTSNITIFADYNGEATLHLLTVRSKAASSPGESLYGVVARGAGTALHLDEVAVSVAPGGDGVDGAGCAPGTPGVGTCPPSDGGAGAPSTTVGAGASAGFFNDAGYVAVPGVGAAGNGGAGLAGVPGADGGCKACVTGCASALISCNSSNAPASCGGAGQSGCPGSGGSGGAVGTGGGSSIGVFAVGANVTVRGAGIQTGNGGAGGAGGLGGDGGTASVGAQGNAAPTCTTACGAYPNCTTTVAGSRDPGAAGGRGGSGGAGAAGGAGAGGHSYGIYVAGDAAVTLAAGASVAHGNPGISRGNGAAGKAGDRFP